MGPSTYWLSSQFPGLHECSRSKLYNECLDREVLLLVDVKTFESCAVYILMMGIVVCGCEFLNFEVQVKRTLRVVERSQRVEGGAFAGLS